jgi:hypothetical protein
MAEAELVDIRRKLIGPVHDKRRWIAIGALVLGLGAAWLQGRDDRTQIQVSLLLTHAEVRLAGASIDYQRLAEVIIVVPAGEPGEPSPLRQSLTYTPRRVPKVTAIVPLQLPEGVTTLDIGCVFRLGAGAAPLRTWTSASVDPSRDGVQVLDIDRCGDLEGARGGRSGSR